MSYDRPNPRRRIFLTSSSSFLMRSRWSSSAVMCSAGFAAMRAPGLEDESGPDINLIRVDTCLPIICPGLVELLDGRAVPRLAKGRNYGRFLGLSGCK